MKYIKIEYKIYKNNFIIIRIIKKDINNNYFVLSQNGLGMIRNIKNNTSCNWNKRNLNINKL